MKDSVVLRLKDFDDIDALVGKLNIAQPDEVVISLTEPTDLKIFDEALIVDSLDKLIPMIPLFTHGAVIVANVLEQLHNAVRNRKGVLLRAQKNITKDAFDLYLQILFENVPNIVSAGKPKFGVMGNAADLISSDSTASRLLDTLRNKYRFPSMPVAMIGTTQLSLSILDTDTFRKFLAREDSTVFYLTDYEQVTAQDLKYIVTLLSEAAPGRGVIFDNIDLMLKAVDFQDTPEGAEYEIIIDRSTAYQEPELVNPVAKYSSGDKVILTDIMTEAGIGVTSEGYYIPLRFVSKI